MLKFQYNLIIDLYYHLCYTLTIVKTMKGLKTMNIIKLILGLVYLTGLNELSKLPTNLENEKLWEKPTTSVENYPEKPTKSTPIAPKTEIVNLDGDYTQYEEIIMNTCPSQRGAYRGWEYDSRVSAMGIVPSGPNKTTPMYSLNAFIETWWNSYKLGRQAGKHMMSSLNNMSEFDSTYANSRVGMFIDFDGLFVSWDNSWENGQSININEEQRQVLNKMASDGTNYLRWLDATYKAKCPND